MEPVIQFVVIALVCALLLWALGQFPTLDATIVKFIRIIILVLLSLMLLNLILVAIFGHGLTTYFR